MEYVSPGDAFSSSLEHSLLLRQQQARQQQQDQLDQQREARMSRIQEEERQQAREALAEKRQEFADSQKDKQKASFEKSLSTMLPGDIPSPDMVEQSKKFGLGHLFPVADDAVVKALPVPESIAAPGDNGAPQGPMPQPTPQAPLPVKFLGSPKQREQNDMDAKVTAIRERLATAEPGSPEERSAILDYEMTTNKQVPARQTTGNENIGVFRVDPARNTVQRSVRGVDGRSGWQDWSGDVPKGAHFLQEPIPPSTAGADARKDSARLRVYNTAITELNKAAGPYEDQLKNVDNAMDVLNEKSPAADAHVAPMILKALVAGQGSGFRMTKSEIDQVQNARTKWQSMEAAFRKWSADPKDATFFDDAQRADFAKLLTTVRAATMRHLQEITTTRNDVDLLDDPRDIQKRVTKLHADKVTSKDDKAAADKPAAAAPKRVRYDLNGKVIQ